jgi:hypothetical protein
MGGGEMSKKTLLRGLNDFPPAWEEEAIVHGVFENKDRSITISVRVSVLADDGRRWSSVRIMRLHDEQQVYDNG